MWGRAAAKPSPDRDTLKRRPTWAVRFSARKAWNVHRTRRAGSHPRFVDPLRRPSWRYRRPVRPISFTRSGRSTETNEKARGKIGEVSPPDRPRVVAFRQLPFVMNVFLLELADEFLVSLPKKIIFAAGDPQE